MSRLITNAVRHTGASADSLTLDSGGGVTVGSGGITVPTGKLALPGCIIQVVQSLNNTITDYAGSSSWRDIGISQAITPVASSSKILIQGMVTVSGASPSGFSVGFQILRGSTVVPTAPSTDGQSSTFAMHVSGSNDDDCGTVSFSYIDSPSTTSATTYKFQALARDNAAFSINASNDHSDDTNANFRQRGQSTITLMEIAG